MVAVVVVVLIVVIDVAVIAGDICGNGNGRGSITMGVMSHVHRLDDRLFYALI